MPTPSHDVRLTYDDFLLFPDDGLRHEIIDGAHYVTPSPNQRHQELVGRLHLSLGAYLQDRPDKGRLFLSPFDVVFSFHDVVEPDLVFVGPDQLDILTAQNIQGTPALVIEVLSPSTRTRDRRDQARALRTHWCAGVLARGSGPECRHRLPAERRRCLSARRPLDCPRARHAGHAARAGMVCNAFASVPLETLLRALLLRVRIPVQNQRDRRGGGVPDRLIDAILPDFRRR